MDRWKGKEIKHYSTCFLINIPAGNVEQVEKFDYWLIKEEWTSVVYIKNSKFQLLTHEKG